MKAMCGGDLEGWCKGLGGVRPCPDHAKMIEGRGSEFHTVVGTRSREDIEREREEAERGRP